MAGRAAPDDDPQLDQQLFLRALRDVNVGFDVFCRATGEGAGLNAMRWIYAQMPLMGLGSRASVVRQYLILVSSAAGNRNDAAYFGQLSDDDIIVAANSAGIPI